MRRPEKVRLTSITQALELLADVDRKHAPARVIITDVLLSEAELDDDTVRHLLQQLSTTFPTFSSSVQALDLSFNDLSDAFWLPTGPEKSEIVSLSRLTTLNLSNNRFGLLTMDHLFNAWIAASPRLRRLDLSMNSWPPSFDAAFALEHLATCANLESLDLSCLNLCDSDLEPLLHTIARGWRLEKLFLRLNQLTDVSATAFVDALTSNQCRLQQLSLAGNELTNNGLAAFLFAIERMSSLHTLDLDENEIDQYGLLLFQHTLRSVTAPFMIRSIYVKPRDVNDAIKLQLHAIQQSLLDKIVETYVTSSAATAQALASPNSPNGQLASKQLNLSGVKMQKKLRLPTVLNDHLVHVALESIRACPSWKALEVLDLSGNAISTRGTTELGLFLSLLPALRVLNLSKNHITDSALVSLADGLEPNATLQELVLHFNHITDNGAKLLYLKAFTANLQRRILLSEGNQLTAECKVMLHAIAQAHDLRKRFVPEFSHQQVLNFSGKGLRQYGAAAIVEMLVVTRCECTSLDLSHNGLGDEGAFRLAQLLRQFGQLTKLDLSFNEIGDAGAEELGNALTENSTLETLVLHSCIPGSVRKPPVSDRGLVHLAECLHAHPSITHLDLRNNFLTPKITHAIVELLSKNKSLVKFNNSPSAVFLARFGN